MIHSILAAVAYVHAAGVVLFIALVALEHYFKVPK